MTNAPFASIDDYRDIQSLNYYAEAVGAGADPETVLACYA
jgi:oligo-1,6-glucosidase